MKTFFPNHITYVIHLLNQYRNHISPQDCSEIVVTPIILERIDLLRDRFTLLKSTEGLTEPDQIHRNLRIFHTLLMELEMIECFALPIITHYQKEFDGHLTSILHRICDEVGCPVNPPHVCTLSTGVAHRGSDYYWYHPSYSTIFIPAAERFSLLNLPDLLHELGHHILLTYKDSFMEPFSNWFSECHADLEKELLTEGISDPNRIDESEEIFLKKWPSFWAEEVVCDLIATYCVGKAFAWTNLKLCQSYPADTPEGIYNYSETHPPDAYRMRAILKILKHMGDHDDKIEKIWNDYKNIICPVKPSLYDLYFPISLIDKMTGFIHSACDDIGLISCTINTANNDTIIFKLSKAWSLFKTDMDRLFEIKL